jgi:GGDEF domain-containing protein
VNETTPVLAGVSFAAGTLSVSIGVACAAFPAGALDQTDAEAGETLFRLADAALYRAKRGGRNHVHISAS